MIEEMEDKDKMTEYKISDHFSYILSFDDIDLCNFDYQTERRRDAAVLWSQEKLDGTSKYYKIEISMGQEDTEIDFVPSDIYKCHLCNIEVPTQYADQHENSDKHNKNIEIVNIALDRASKSFKPRYPIKKTHNTIKDTHFCEVCCKVIYKKDKRQHYTSNYHKTAIGKDKFFQDFLKIFKKENDDDFNMFDTTLNEEKTEEKYINLIKEYDSDDEIENHTVTDKNDVENDIPTKELEHHNAETKADNKYRTIVFEIYSKDYTNTNNIETNLAKIDKDSFIIKNVDNCQVKVIPDNYHTYLYVESKCYCQMCNVSVTDKMRHETNDTHLKNVLKTIDENFCRKIDGVSSYCLICNLVIVDTYQHQFNETHKVILQQNRIQNEHSDGITETAHETSTTGNETTNLRAEFKPNNTKKLKITCFICNIQVFNKDINILKHIQTKEHDSNKKIFLNLNEICKKKKSVFNCGVCKVWFLNETKCLEHIQTDLHTKKIYIKCDKQSFRSVIYNVNSKYKENNSLPFYENLYNNLMEFNKIKKIDNYSFHCNICSVYVSRKNEMDHAVGSMHKLNKNKLVLKSD